jgi:hypothetical protein
LNQFKIKLKAFAKKPQLVAVALFFLLFLILEALFVPVNDDWLWGSVSGIDSLKNGYAEASSRYVSNTLLIFLLRCPPVRIIFFATVMAGILYLILKLVPQTPLTPMLVAILLLCVSRGIFREVYAWSSGFINYTFSVFIDLAYILFAKWCWKNAVHTAKNIKLAIIIFILTLPAQLILEISTLYIVMLSFFCFAIFGLKNKKIHLPFLAWFLSSIIGMLVIMLPSFNNTIYKEYRSITMPFANGFKSGLLNLVEASISMFTYAVLGNAVIWSILAALFIVLLHKQWRSISGWFKKVALILSELILALSIIIFILNDIFNVSYPLVQAYKTLKYLKFYFAAFLVLFIFLFVISKLFIKSRKIYFSLVSCAIFTLPYFVVSPFACRSFFASYIFFVMIFAELFHYMFKEKLANFNTKKLYASLLSIFAVLSVMFVYIYSFSLHEYTARNKYIFAEAKKGSKEITISTLRFESFYHTPTPYGPSGGYLPRVFNAYYGLDEDIRYIID